jgi:hypothetical protein
MTDTYRDYDGVKDAEYILENIMHRRNWTSETRDKLAAFLVSVNIRNSNRQERKR